MTSTPATNKSAAGGDETPTVFLVHGHDETFKFEVAHYIGQMLDQRVRVVILHDEPNAGLDPIMSHQIHELIVEVRDSLGVTGLLVTHSRACAVHCGDRIGIIDEGKLAIEGTVEEMLHSDHDLARACQRVLAASRQACREHALA